MQMTSEGSTPGAGEPGAGGAGDPGPEPRPGSPGELSERELGVLRLIALGHTNVEIAEQLYVPVRSVETHRAQIQQKLGLSSRSELVGYAHEHGLVDP
jgi:two-component system, NarL family, response regulator NreC